MFDIELEILNKELYNKRIKNFCTQFCQLH